MLDTTSYPGVNVELHEDGGWILMQRMFPVASASHTSFERDWSNYSDGFGDGSPSSADNYWLGLRNIHRLVQLGASSLRIEVSQLLITVYKYCLQILSGAVKLD